MVTLNPLTRWELEQGTERINDFGHAIPFGQSGNAWYKARIRFDRPEFRDGFGKWKPINDQQFWAAIAYTNSYVPDL